MDSNYQKKYLKYKKKYIDFKGNMTGGTLGASASAEADLNSSNLKLLIGLPEELIDKILAGIDLKGLQSLTKLDSEVLTRIALKHINTRLNEIEYDLEKIINSKQTREPRIMQYVSRINSDGEYRRTLARRFEMKIDSFIDKFNELISALATIYSNATPLAKNTLIPFINDIYNLKFSPLPRLYNVALSIDEKIKHLRVLFICELLFQHHSQQNPLMIKATFGQPPNETVISYSRNGKEIIGEMPATPYVPHNFFTLENIFNTLIQDIDNYAQLGQPLVSIKIERNSVFAAFMQGTKALYYFRF